MTSPGALNICSASAADCPASPAPGSGNSGDSRVFGQQLRDAHESLGARPDNKASESTSGPKRAAARGAEKKGRGDGPANKSVPVAVTTPSSPVAPLTLLLGVLPAGNESDDAETSGNGSGLQGAADQAQPEVSDGLTSAPAAQGAPADLSFALKLDAKANPDAGGNENNGGQSAQGQTPPRIEAPVNSTAETSGTAKEARRADLEEDAPAPGPRNDAISRLAAFQATEKSAPADPEPAAQQPRVDTTKALETAAVQSTAAADHASKPAGPLKDLSIQVGQTQNDKVELRLVERSGEVQVAVRATNPDVAQGLRQGLPDLVDRLEQNGYRAEAWRPGTTTTAVQGTGETRQRPMQFQQDQSQPQSQSGGQQQSRQQNRQNQSYRPQWVQELEGNLSGGSIAGESNGIRR